MKWFTKMNFPNKLTVLRMFCVVLVLLIALFPFEAIGIVIPSWEILGVNFSLTRFILLFLFVFGSITDYVDGHYARKHNLVTTFGKFMDPIADKLLVNVTFFLVASWGEIPILIPIIFIIRDTIVDAIRMIAIERRVVIAASPLGKAKTVTQMIALILLLIQNVPFVLWNIPLASIVAYLAALVSLLSGIDYFYKNRNTVLEGANYRG